MQRSIGLLAVVVLLAGCEALSWNGGGGARQTSSSSQVEYLHPSGEEAPPVDQQVPQELTTKVVHAGSAGPGGSGSVDSLFVGVLCLLLLFGAWRAMREGQRGR